MSIKLPLIKSATALTLVLIAASAAKADEERYDRAIEAAVIEKVAEKIGSIRQTIDYNQPVILITKKDVLKASKRNNSLLPAKIWVAPKPENALPPVVSPDLEGLDKNTTASITRAPNKDVKKIIWEKFDGNGYPID